jgi:signal transduction histidine kinase
VLAGFIFERYRAKKRTNDILNEKNHAIEQAFLKLKETQHDLVETEKQREAQSVRVKIARDIHDEIGSGLTKITLLSDVAKRKSNTAEIADAFLKITLYSKAVSAALSEIVWSINPGNDNMQSMITYMKAAANTLLEDSGVNFTLNFS